MKHFIKQKMKKKLHSNHNYKKFMNKKKDKTNLKRN